MPNTKKILLGGLNTDDAEYLLDPKEYLGALNIRFATTENGEVGKVANIEGTIQKTETINSLGVRVPFILPGGVNQTIGAFEDTKERRVIWINWNSLGSHGIYCYDADDDLIYTVLQSSDVTTGLGFQQDKFIHSIAMIDNMFYWTDGKNNQRRINVESGIKSKHPTFVTDMVPYTLPVTESVISLIRPLPAIPLRIVKATQTSPVLVNNFIKEEAFQFAYRFIYKDGEISCFSPLSVLANYNTPTDTFNAIDVTIPAAQNIQQDVVKIELAVKYMNGGKYFIIHTWTFGFSLHNSGTLLTYRFLNDSIGVAVDDASAVKQFDSIPVKSQTLEIAKSRLFLGNNLSGYDSPDTTSLSLSTIVSGGATTFGNWFRFIYRNNSNALVTVFYLDVTNIGAQSGYYRYNTTTVPPYPPTINFPTELTFVGAGVSDVVAFLGINFSQLVSVTSMGTQSVVTNPPSVPSVINKKAFKSDSSYRVGIVFHDFAGRKCGVVTNDNLKISTADRTYSTIAYTTGIQWLLSNVNAANEIPSWATHYSVVRTRSLRTSFFMQLQADNMTYFSKDATSGDYVFPNGTYSANHFGIGINIKKLNSYGLGYSYQEGDIVKLYVNGGATYSLKVKDTYSDWVICDLANLDSLDSTDNILYEIYTPYVGSTDEFFYETGKVYPITSDRRYSVLTDVFEGDITILERNRTNNYPVEAMSPSDKYWKRWFTDIGRPNAVINIETANNPFTVYYSNTYNVGANGLSTFDAPDFTYMSTEMGAIERLVQTSKVQDEGTVMLVIGQQETASMYIGETQVFDNNGTSFLAKSSGVIGNVNILRGSYGTINPESAFKWQGAVIWFDANKGAVVKYDVNGLFPISSRKMQKYFRKIGQDILAIKKDPTNYKLANPNLPLRVLGHTDPYHTEYLLTVPRVTTIPQNTILSDVELGSQSYTFTTDPDCSLALRGYEPPAVPVVTQQSDSITNCGFAIVTPNTPTNP